MLKCRNTRPHPPLYSLAAGDPHLMTVSTYESLWKQHTSHHFFIVLVMFSCHRSEFAWLYYCVSIGEWLQCLHIYRCSVSHQIRVTNTSQKQVYHKSRIPCTVIHWVLAHCHLTKLINIQISKSAERWPLNRTDMLESSLTEQSRDYCSGLGIWREWKNGTWWRT